MALGIKDYYLLLLEVFFKHLVVMNYILQIKIKFVGCIICLLLIKSFLDGNKRTATALCMFLNKKYGIKSNVFDVNNPHRLSLDVANGNISYDDLLEMW